jgi:hypothetical protein
VLKRWAGLLVPAHFWLTTALPATNRHDRRDESGEALVFTSASKTKCVHTLLA